MISTMARDGAMRPGVRAIDLNACAPPVEVDNRIPLHHYYRIATNLLKQANIYREERNLIDLYIILLRFSSLMCETIPSHRDYHVLLPKERATFRKKLLDVIGELETLKPDVQRQVDEVNQGHMYQLDDQDNSYGFNSTRKQVSPSTYIEQPASRSTSQSVRKFNNERNHILPSDNLQSRQTQKLSVIAHPKEETLSRHSLLGPNGLRSNWTGPTSGIRVQYPNDIDLSQIEISGLNLNEQHGPPAVKESKQVMSDLDSVLSLDDGRWSASVDEPCTTDTRQQDFLQLSIRQPSPPPVLAQIQSEVHSIPPSRVADPRPGPPKASQEGLSTNKTYQNLHIPVNMMECFLRLAEMNTAKNLETCGVLAGSLKNRTFYVTTLIVPKQESTSDSCQTTDEEEIFNVQDKRSLFPLGWIHTHPTQTCFMSSIDLHTHYSYQVMLPEAIAIVMAPTDTSRTHGIFHLSDPSGVSVIRNCQERGFHPHEEPLDGNPIYEHCSHVFLNPSLKFDTVDLRNS
ncbi:AMSH-like ubiquitin thioesterase 3 [Dioscorea cayenensis subsp. rotundata]|uniref:AMSH-like ubiquitin thioesterase 3 n=1 Tax=Dioscorea cayennensis subsp. rotundata TaxID=55577 RepID=A0AB40CAH5_DIOCR|nr:AMSH-like ubiquitin thioesterase 3 [Dioscorea cayenensis subsp. rotundata]